MYFGNIFAGYQVFSPISDSAFLSEAVHVAVGEYMVDIYSYNLIYGNATLRIPEMVV